MDEVRLPRVSPSMMRVYDGLCTRRLHAEHSNALASEDPMGRASLREAFLDAARVAQAEGSVPRPEAFVAPAALEAEERAVFAQASSWYLRLFGREEATTHLHGLDRPSDSPARGVRVGGFVDLTFHRADGRKELRQVDLWSGRRPPADDPLTLDTAWFAALRLTRWVGDAPLLVSWVNLLDGDLRRTEVGPGELATFGPAFDERLQELRARIAVPEATPGRDCGFCHHVWRCPAHPEGINVKAAKHDLRPGVIRLTPTALEAWTRCPRAWRNEHLLRLPRSDEGPPPDHGNLVHALLKLVHETGSCHDEEHVAAMLEGHAADERLRSEIASHERRCPVDAVGVGHELVLARFHKDPWPPFMATARIDALWEHDGVLEVRDYKTGRAWHDRVADDPKAKVQAFVAARVAEERGLRLRLRYEHLSSEVADDPDVWEPDADDLAANEEQLRQIVEAMRALTDWAGVADESACRWCAYRSVCPDSACPSESSWPLVADDALVEA